MHRNYASGITLLSTTFYKLLSMPLNSYTVFIYSLGGVYIDLEGFESSSTKRFSNKQFLKHALFSPKKNIKKKLQLTVTGQEYVSLSPFIWINTV